MLSHSFIWANMGCFLSWVMHAGFSPVGTGVRGPCRLPGSKGACGGSVEKWQPTSRHPSRPSNIWLRTSRQGRMWSDQERANG
ncbi:uncharacterized protein PpBr36_09169 [Pyricularia pennisetigena]|uniref:uncharacterized protein n=1 Tax=Pyricularia pennisetigena TaxID=1578925 RepID=UPI0011517ED9